MPTEDGQHHRLTDEHLAKWVNALVRTLASHGRLAMNASIQCAAEATASQPPDGILMPRASAGSPASLVRAVSIPPSHRRNVKSPTLCTTSSIRDTLSSRPSSGVPGPGYYSGKAIKWLGEKCLQGIEDAVIFKRCWQHESHLKRWLASRSIGKEREELFKFLEDAIELSK